MTADDYATLMDFLATRFARMDAAFAALDARLTRMEARQDAMEARQEAMEARQEAMEGRLTRSEVLWESMRDDLRRVAEGVVAVSERLDRFQAETRARFDGLDRGIGGVQVQFDRFAVDFGTVQLDHGARIDALERHRKRRDSEG